MTRRLRMSPSSEKVRSNVVLSVLAHVALVATLVLAVKHAPVASPFRMPGTAKGVHQLTYYSPGSAAPAHSDGPLLPITKPTSAKASPTVEQAKTPAEVAFRSEIGVGTTAVSGVGDGEITMALQRVFPPPKPDLSSIAPGHHGEVVLNAVIDAEGKIAQLTMLKGVNPAIDNVVIATVQTWTYQPATRNGAAIASEQELHFYYERV